MRQVSIAVALSSVLEFWQRQWHVQGAASIASGRTVFCSSANSSTAYTCYLVSWLSLRVCGLGERMPALCGAAHRHDLQSCCKLHGVSFTLSTA